MKYFEMNKSIGRFLDSPPKADRSKFSLTGCLHPSTPLRSAQDNKGTTRQEQSKLYWMYFNNIRRFYCRLPSLATSLTSNLTFIKREGPVSAGQSLWRRTGVSYTQLQQNLAKYQAWIRQVNIERITASANLN